MKKILIIVILLITQSAYSQEWAKVGTKWYYSNFESWIGGTKEGYVLLESEKDTVINDTLVKQISVDTYFSSGEYSKGSPFFTKKTNGKYLYKYETDSSWNLLFDTSWQVNQPYKIRLRDGDTFSAYNFSISGIGSATINGVSLKYTNLQFEDDLYFNNITFYETIGYAKYFILTPTYEAVDGFSAGPLRCFYSDTIFFNSNPDLKCDTLIYQDLRLGTTSGLQENKIKIYPNPVFDEIRILVPNKDVKMDSYEIYTIDGQLIVRSPVVNQVISASGLKTGLYFIALISDDKRAVYKILKN